MRLSVLAMRLRTRALLTPRKAKPKKRRLEDSSLERREAERQKAHLGAASKSDAARTLTPALPLRRGPRPDPDRARPHGAGALAFRRPTAALRRFDPARLRPRFLESPDANGRTLSGTSAASTSQSEHAPDGTMPKPPVSAVYRCTPENRPRSASRSTLARAIIRGLTEANNPYNIRLS
jgi:hypothetical protein